MARSFFHLLNHLKKNGSVFVIVAVAVFGLLVFLLFRGHSAGPREAAAKDAGPVSRPGETSPPRVIGGSPDPAASGPGAVPPVDAAQPSSAAAAVSGSGVDAAIAEAVGLVRAQPGEIIQVRNRLNKLLQGQTTPEQKQTIKDEMARLSKDWLFGPAAFPGDMLCDTYIVKSGDMLDIIGRRMKVPYEMLMQINGIQRARSLQVGHALKVIHGPFHVKVSRSTFTLDLYLQDTYVRSFRVGLGKAGYETPTGHWRVQEKGKLIKPPWTDPDTGRLYKPSDPDYPLGTRWIGLEGIEGQAKARTGFAIHGTKEPNQIGAPGSRGCIRMYNDDVELIYNLLVPVYSQVDVSD